MSDYRDASNRVTVLRTQDGEIIIHLHGQPVGMTMVDPYVAGIVEMWLKTAVDDIKRTIIYVNDIERAIKEKK